MAQRDSRCLRVYTHGNGGDARLIGIAAVNDVNRAARLNPRRLGWHSLQAYVSNPVRECLPGSSAIDAVKEFRLDSSILESSHATSLALRARVPALHDVAVQAAL
jgi:hypothetical protein